ncbi:MAG: CpsD/CapB family tyrosine-protein kinase [Chloroflexi bacterium]|nr:CpsD/CapB family tyrosine-protein kinase [Chloroflexota bacterium]
MPDKLGPSATLRTGLSALIAYANPRSVAAEAYRQLRANIQFYSLDKPLGTVLVTSTEAEEGKSTVLANLAITIAQMDNTVILADCDLRRPMVHRLFDVKNEEGLTTVLLDASMKQLPLAQTAIPNLRILPSGPLPPNPSELLGSRRMTDLIAQLRGQADYVLFDSPPILAVSDAVVLATRLDGALLVINAGRTRREMAQKARAALQRVNANLLGVVLNNVKYDVRLHRYYGEEETD